METKLDQANSKLISLERIKKELEEEISDLETDLERKKDELLEIEGDIMDVEVLMSDLKKQGIENEEVGFDYSKVKEQLSLF
jgi:septal ring factor EnvC (AmiA/AmiB activator)